jgi:thiamine pyrophosphate-dependent acetolactate synthase large subunit-like protein
LAWDSGSGTNWYARDVKLRCGTMASLSGGLATMGCGVPYAIAAKFACPERAVIALVGDGAMQMNGNAELPHITFEQAKAYMSALFGGDPDAWGILKSSAREMAAGVLPETEKV